MNKNPNSKILIISPYLEKSGGVSNYYRILKPLLTDNYVYLYRGTKSDNTAYLKYFFSMLNSLFIFIWKLLFSNVKKVIINNSFNRMSVYRDLVFILLTKIFNKKYLIHHHGWDNFFYQHINQIDKLLLKIFYSKAEKVIVLSKDFKKRIVELGYPEEKIIVETTFVDDKLLENFCLSEKNIDNSFNILFLSRIIKEKGIFELLEAFKIIFDKYPFATLYYCGDGCDLYELKKKAEKIRNVFFTGYIRDAQKINYFKKADIFVLPSYSEGFPISLLEAMAFGLPILTTNVGGINDFFQNGKMGFIIEPKNVNDIVDKIEILINNSILRKQMAEYNFLYAKEKFLASSAAKRFQTYIN